jgi:hypothetical protein
MRVFLLATLVAIAGSGIVRPQDNPAASDAAAVNLFDGLRDGRLAAIAEGRGDGRMTLSITNQSSTRLRVVLPPGLVASGASGQFGGGGIGGPGGGFGMPGGGGGQMGGGGFNNGGFGGQLGGGGGGFGNNGMGLGNGMGGMGMNRGMGSGAVMPAPLGMINLGRLIMTLTGPLDSWDRRSLFQNNVGMGMGGNGMGNGGGFNGGNLGGNGFGPGRGFRSLPVIGPPSALVEPGRTRHLPTSLVSLSSPGPDGQLTLPAKGEELTLKNIDTDPRFSPKVRAALKHLAEAQAPETVAQLVLWHIAGGLDWSTLARVSRPWANRSELALAHDIATRISTEAGALEHPEGRLAIEVVADAGYAELGTAFRSVLAAQPIFGLPVRSGIPNQPICPSIACRTRIAGPEATVQLWLSDPSGKWVSAGKFALPVPETRDVKAAATALSDAWMDGVLSRLIRVQLAAGPKTKGKESYKIRIDNVSSLVLHGLVLSGTAARESGHPSALGGLCLPPKKTLTVPATSEVVERLGFKNGVRVLAACLTGI